MKGLSTSVVLVWFAILKQVTAPMPYTCKDLTQPVNCLDNPRIRVKKESEIYELRLCFDDQCSEDISFYFRCQEICEACKTLTPTNGKNSNKITPCPNTLSLLQYACCLTLYRLPYPNLIHFHYYNNIMLMLNVVYPL